MLPKERVRCAFEKRRPDRVPLYQSGFSSRVASALLGREAYVGGGIEQFREARALWEGDDAHAEFLERARHDAVDVCLALDLDYVRPVYWRLRQRPSQRIDEHTFLWGDPEGEFTVRRFEPGGELFPIVAHHPPPPSGLEHLETLVAEQERQLETYQPGREAFDAVAWAIRRTGGTHAVNGCGIVCGIPYDPPIWLEAIVLRPDLVERYLDMAVERARRTIPVMGELGTPYLHGGGDFASQLGPFCSPQAFRTLVLPRLQAISACCRQHGAFHLFASDGNLWPVADDLFARSGISGFYELDRRAGMDPERLRTRFPEVTLLGGINSHTVHVGPVEAIREEARTAIEVAQRHGGMIVGCSNQIVCDTPVAHVHAMMDELHRWR